MLFGKEKPMDVATASDEALMLLIYEKQLLAIVD